MTVKVEGPATLEAAADALGVDEASLDPEFGIIEIDPDKELYSVMVEEGALNSDFESEKPYRGPFSNPRIAPTGPLQRKRSR